MLRSATLNLPRRLLSTSVKSVSVESVDSKNDSIKLLISQDNEKDKSLTIPLVWLRDHCRSKECYNHSTNQRTSNMVNIFEEAEISGEEDVSVEKSESLHIRWKNGHKSQFKIDELLSNSLRRNSPSTSEYITSWDSATLTSIPRIDLTKLNFSELSKLFVRFGVVIIDGVAPTAEATERLCREIAPIHDTYYGAFWVFSNESKGEDYHEDTAYGQEAIGPHTDGTYFDQTPGIQVFHCLKPAEVGGDTILVDGRKCAELLKEEDPDAFKLLSMQLVEHHYLEGGSDGNVLTTVSRHRPVIELDDQGEFRQLRFNPYDRSPLRSLRFDSAESARETLKFYKAYCKLSKICHDEKNTISTSLRPGSVIFIDNFRVLHSRTAFKGLRQMSGCYLSRDNFLAKARPHFQNDIRNSI